MVKLVRPSVILLDFDGTCVTHDFPRVGRDIGAVPVLRRLLEAGHKFVLFTMRADREDYNPTDDDTIMDVTGPFLTDAVDWFKDNEIELYGIQTNPTQKNWTTSPKAYGQLMIDDSALGTPMIYPIESGEGREYVDWDMLELLLEDMGYLPSTSSVFMTPNELIKEYEGTIMNYKIPLSKREKAAFKFALLVGKHGLDRRENK